MWDPRRLRTLWGFMGSYGNDLTFYVLTSCSFVYGHWPLRGTYHIYFQGRRVAISSLTSSSTKNLEAVRSSETSLGLYRNLSCPEHRRAWLIHSTNFLWHHKTCVSMATKHNGEHAANIFIPQTRAVINIWFTIFLYVIQSLWYCVTLQKLRTPAEFITS
jgi:hypothetical protein